MLLSLKRVGIKINHALGMPGKSNAWVERQENTWPIKGTGNCENWVECERKIIICGECYYECTNQVWDQSVEQFVWKYGETSEMYA